MKCRFCGRDTRNRNRICEYCEPFICEICGEALSRGYCAICGKLVCDNDSRLVGFARVCTKCLQRNPKLGDYDYLKKTVLMEAKRFISPPRTDFIKILELGDLPKGKEVYVHIGLDDFDSPYGLCTTYAAARIAYMVRKSFDVRFLDFPLLVRLNPNIPLKTRGNAGTAIRIRVHIEDLNNLIESVPKLVSKLSHGFFRKTQPALAMYMTERYVVDQVLNRAYFKSVRSVYPPKVLLQELRSMRTGYLIVYSSKQSIPRGIVGAVAAIGATFDDYTFELLAYRQRKNIGKERDINIKSVFQMNKELFPLTFGNVDGNRILIAPKGPDPVLFGIRGETPEIVYKAFQMIEHEDIELWAIFRTNQATSTHIRSIKNVEEAHPYETVMIECQVISADRKNDKVFLKASVVGGYVEGIAYRLQRTLQSNILKLRPNDKIKLVIAITEKTGNTIRGNIEEFVPITLEPETITKNSRCPRCCARLKKKSKNIMYCKKCGLRIQGVFKITIRIPRRELSIGKRYLPPPKAYRHLTMPNERIYFRAKKLFGKVQTYLTEPLLSIEKEVTLIKTETIREPETI